MITLELFRMPCISLFTPLLFQVRNPEDYRLTFRTPPGCIVSNCTSFVGIDINTGNDGVLDIYMEGQALGWVAVGFTETPDMVCKNIEHSIP